jgi:hemolysin III
MSAKLREPVSAGTHLGGALLSVAGLVVLVVMAVQRGTVWHTVAFAIYGASLIALYTASTLYHALPLPKSGIGFLRRFDHMMIYVLIAGTYTPLCLLALHGAWRWAVLGSIWGLAAVGMVVTGVWFKGARWLSAGIYLLMGWLVIVAVGPLARAVPAAGVAWLAAGGVFYTVGAVIYGSRWPNLAPGFGFHEVFHVFVLLGSLSHFWLMFRYLMAL